jgi:hypothetical protein
VVSLFDEYVNDLLALREGSCLPRYILLQLLFFSLDSAVFKLLLWLASINMDSFDSVKLLTARPKYHRNMSPSSEKKKPGDNHNIDSKNGRESPCTSKLISEKSRTLKWTIQQYRPMQVRTHEVLLLFSIKPVLCGFH